MNLEGISDWSVANLFVDMAAQSRHWGTPATPWDEAATIDNNGWPTTDAGLVLSTEANPLLGAYHLSFTGEATLYAVGGSNLAIQNKVYTPSINTTTATVVVVAGPIMISFMNTHRSASSPANSGVTNVHLYRPGYPSDGSVLFTTPIQEALDKFSVIRYMDAENTNSSQQLNWSDRRLPSYASQCSDGPLQGMAWEYVIALCNATGKDAYINIPAQVSNDYITSLAELFKNGDTVNGIKYAGLDPNLHLYIEWSNEVWNSGFGQFQTNYNAAQSEVAAGGSSLNYDGQTNPWYIGWRRVAEQIVNTSKIFRSVFGSSLMMTQVRPVLEFQYNNAQETANQELSYIFQYFDNADGLPHVATTAPITNYLWGAGGATYYTSNNDAASTVNALFASGIPNTGFGNVCNVEAGWAKAFGLKDIAYEGGWGVGNSTNDDSVQEAARFDPRAEQSLATCQDDFDEAGGDLDILYSSSGPLQWTWGMTDNINDIDTPLYQAIDSINTTTAPAFNNGTVLNGTAGQWTSIPVNSYAITDEWNTNNYPLLWTNNGYIGWLVDAPRKTTYIFSVTGTNTVAGGKVGIYVDGVFKTALTITGTSKAGVISSSTTFTTNLEPSVHGVIISAQHNAPGSLTNAGTVTSVQCEAAD